MKKWPEKILITSEEGFKKFKSNAEKYFEVTNICGCEIIHPDKFPCIATKFEYSYETYGKFIDTTTHIDIKYVYLDDFK